MISASSRRLALLLTLGALVLLIPVASAGAVAQPCGGVPQISDVSGDGHHSSSDVLAAWFSEESGHLQAVIKVRSGTWEPEHDDAEENGSGFGMIFTVAGKTSYVRARDWPHSEKPVSFDYGTFAQGSWFASAGATTGEVTYAAFGGTVAIDVPASTGAVTGARLAGPFVLTYDGSITAGEPDWVDQAPGGTAPTDSARGADYVVGSCGASGAGTGTVAVQLTAPAKLGGAGKARIAGKVVPARAGVDVELTRQSPVGSVVTHLTTAADGSFAATVRLREATRFRAVADGIASQTIGVAMSSKVKIRARESRSGAIAISGRLDPALPGRLLLLARNEVQPTTSKRAGSRSFAFRFGPGRLAPGRYEVVYVPARGRAERSTSNSVRVRGEAPNSTGGKQP